MRVSAGLPTGMEGLTYPIPFSDPENVIRIAQAAEKFGYDSVWGNDHMTTQNYVRAEFPVPPRFWEPLITYAFVLSETKTIKVGTGILVLPMRHDIVVAAKQIVTLDHFGKGRLELGVGIGAYREEFKALQPDAKIDRGDIVDEGLQALSLLFKDRVASFDGQYYKFRDVELFPKPFQKKLPIYVSGNHANNIERTVKWADGWLPAGMDVDRIRAGVKPMREKAEKAGRDWKTIEVCAAVRRPSRQDPRGRARKLPQEPDEQAPGLAAASRRSRTRGAATHEDINLIGSPDEVIEKALAFKKAGVTHLLGLYFAANSVPRAARPDADLRRRGHAEDEVILSIDQADRAPERLLIVFGVLAFLARSHFLRAVVTDQKDLF